MRDSLGYGLYDAMVRDGNKIDYVEISFNRRVREGVGTFIVSFHVPGVSWFEEKFEIRDMKNPTEIGRKLFGIETRDKRISIYSKKGREIEKYLHRTAKKYAGGLTKGRIPVVDLWENPDSKRYEEIAA